ncbi:MAG: radical SAM protein [Candidatus Omnitrophota bacterium]|nr:radical SAM protein [Candidatus Omnitrophota bacterium]
MNITARSSGALTIKKPLKVLVCIVTLMAFLSNTVLFDAAWAVGSPSTFTGRGVDRAGGSGFYKVMMDINNLSVPLRFGEIREASKGTNGKTIIHIQDAHCNYAAQISIEAIIKHLTGTYTDIDLVSMEGGTGDYDLSIFDDIKDAKIRGKVADYFVGEGRVSGPELFAINNTGRVKLFGIEDEKLYIDNLNVYKESLSFKKDADQCLGILSAAVNSLKEKVYSPALKDLDKKSKLYAAGKISFKDYLLYLDRRAEDNKVDISRHKNVSSILELLHQEEKIDFDKADKERAMLIDKMSARLSQSDLEELARKTVLFRNKDIFAEDFYSYLLRKAKFISVNFDTLPNLAKYAEYLKKYENADRYAIFNEIKEVERSLMERLADTEDQRTLASAGRDIAIIEDIFSISLTRDEFDYYSAHEEEFRAKRFIGLINDKAPRYGLTIKVNDDLERLDRYRESMERFYASALKRDGAFIENIEKKLKDDGSSVTVLVTGGFHKGNLSRLFKERGYSYIEIMPKFENAGRECNYFKLLAGEESGLEKSIGSAVSSIQIASLCNKLGVDVHGEKSADIFKVGVRALRSLYGSKGKQAFKLEDGRFVIFENENGNPVCKVSGILDDAELVSENSVALNARSLINAFYEIGRERDYLSTRAVLPAVRDSASGRRGTRSETLIGALKEIIPEAEAQALYGSGQKDPKINFIGVVREALLEDPDIAALSGGFSKIEVKISRNPDAIADINKDMVFLNIDHEQGIATFYLREAFLELLLTQTPSEQYTLLRLLVMGQAGKKIKSPELAALLEETAKLHNLAGTTAAEIVGKIGKIGGMVSLDGMTGSGKSTYAGMLKKRIQVLAQCDVDIFTLDMFLFDKTIREAINKSVLGQPLSLEERTVIEGLMGRGILPGFVIGKPWSGNEYIYRNDEIKDFLGKLRSYLDWQDGSKEFDVLLHNVYDQSTRTTLPSKTVTLAKSSSPGRKRIFIVDGLYSNREDVQGVYDVKIRLRINEETSKGRYFARSIARSGQISDVDQKKYDAFIYPSYLSYDQRTGQDIDIWVDLDDYSSVLSDSFRSEPSIRSREDTGGVEKNRGPPETRAIRTARKAFGDPKAVRDQILHRVTVPHMDTEEFSNRPTIYVFPTRFCPVGCKFCYFASPMGAKKTRENAFDDQGTEKFIAFTKAANPAGIVVSGGGDPFVELDKVVKIVKESRADKITLVTSGFWAKNPAKVEEILNRISEAAQQNPNAPEVILRLSIDEYHQVRVPLSFHANIIKAFSEKHLGQNKFRLMVHSLRGDGALTQLEELLRSEYGLSAVSRGGVDEVSSEIALDNGLNIKVRRVDIFNANQEIDLNDITRSEVDANFRAFARKNTYKATRGDGRIMMGIQKNANGEDALDFLINYDGLMEVWASSMPDNRSSLYEDTYDQFRKKSITDVITLAMLEKGIKYVKDLVYEVNPIAMDRAIAINIPDWFSRLAFEEEKTRLYVSLRILQDYLKDGRITQDELAAWPKDVRELLTLEAGQLRQLYHESSYGIVDQYLERPNIGVQELMHLYKLIKLNHYDVTTAQAREIIMESKNLTEAQKLEFLMEAAKLDPRSQESIPALLDALRMSGELISGVGIEDYANAIHSEAGRLVVEIAKVGGQAFLLYVISNESKTAEVSNMALDALGHIAMTDDRAFQYLRRLMAESGDNWALATRVAEIFSTLKRKDSLAVLKNALIRAATEDPLSRKGIAFTAIAHTLIVIAQAERLVMPLEDVIVHSANMGREDIAMSAFDALDRLAGDGVGRAESSMLIITHGLLEVGSAKSLNKTQWKILGKAAAAFEQRKDDRARYALKELMDQGAKQLDDEVVMTTYRNAASALLVIATSHRLQGVLLKLAYECKIREIAESARVAYLVYIRAPKSSYDALFGSSSELAIDPYIEPVLSYYLPNPEDSIYITEPTAKLALVGSPASMFDFMTMPTSLNRTVSLTELNMETRLSFDTIEKDMRFLRAAGLIERENRYGIVVFWVSKDVSGDPGKLAAAKRILGREFATGNITRNSSKKNRERIARSIGSKMLLLGQSGPKAGSVRQSASGQKVVKSSGLSVADSRDDWAGWLEMMKGFDKKVLEMCGKQMFDGAPAMVNIPISEKFADKVFAVYQSAATEDKARLNELVATHHLGNIIINLFRDNTEGRQKLEYMIKKSGIMKSQERIITFAYQKEDDKRDVKLEGSSYVVYMTGDIGKTTTPIGTCGMTGLEYLNRSDLMERKEIDGEKINQSTERFVRGLAAIAGTYAYEPLLDEIAKKDENGIRQLLATGLILVRIRPIDINEIVEFHKHEAEVLKSL